MLRDLPNTLICLSAKEQTVNITCFVYCYHIVSYTNPDMNNSLLLKDNASSGSRSHSPLSSEGGSYPQELIDNFALTLHRYLFQTYLCLFMINVQKVRNIHHLLGSTKMCNDVIVTILTSTWLIWTSWETSSLLMFGRIWMLDTCR